MSEITNETLTPYQPSYEEKWTPEFKKWVDDIVFLLQLHQQEILRLKARVKTLEEANP